MLALLEIALLFLVLVPGDRVFAGVYGPSGDMLVVAPVSDTLIRFRHFPSGLLGDLKKIDDDRFEGDAGHIEFERSADGGVNRARWSLGGGTVAGAGARRDLRPEPVSWSSGEATLHGELILPSSTAPRCVVVVQPGASWTTRYSSNALETAYTFAATGIAALAYDKRGWGESSGERLVAFRTSAEDLAAGAEMLAGRFDVDATRIGVWGLSQGAWIAPLAGTMTDRIRWFVLVGAPGTTPARQEIQRAGALLAATGRPPGQVGAIRRFQELSFRYSLTGRGWTEYLAAREVGERQDWLRYVWSPAQPGPDNFLWGRLNGAYNPLPALLVLDEPILALWGEQDVNVLPEVHRSIFEVALDAAGNRFTELEIVPAADHVLQAASSRDPSSVEDRYAPGVWERMADWMEERCH